MSTSIWYRKPAARAAVPPAQKIRVKGSRKRITSTLAREKRSNEVAGLDPMS
jgi:hypothetical protein